MPPKRQAGFLYPRYVMLLFLEGFQRGSKPVGGRGGAVVARWSQAACVTQPALRAQLQPKMGFVGRYQPALKWEAWSKGPFSACRRCSETSQTLLIAEGDFWTHFLGCVRLGRAQCSLISSTAQFRSCLMLTGGVVLGLRESTIPLLQRGCLLCRLLSIHKASPTEKQK